MGEDKGLVADGGDFLKPGVRVALNPSRGLGFVLVSAHGLALLAILWSGLAWYFQALLALVVLVSALLLKVQSTVSRCGVLEWREPYWRFISQYPDKSLYEGKEVGDQLVWRFLVLLRLKGSGSKVIESFVILPDSTDRNSFRRLRVFLLHR